MFSLQSAFGQLLSDQLDLLFQEDAVLENAMVGISVVDMHSGQVIIDQHANLRMIPASTQKLITAKSALDILGKDFQFRTELRFSGTIDSTGTLPGDLLWIGGGDPVFGDAKFKDYCSKDSIFNQIIKSLVKRGIKKVDGHLIVFDHAYGTERTPRHWLWEDISNYYGSGARAFNFMGNEYEITFSRSTITGQEAEIVAVNPATPGVQLTSEVHIGEKGSGDQAFVFGGPFADHHIVRGSIPPGNTPFTIRAAANSPSTIAAEMLLNELSKNGVQIAKGYQIISSEKNAPDQLSSELLYAHMSPPLKSIVDYLLQESHNLTSEALLKKMALQEEGIKHTDEAAAFLSDYWKQAIPEAENWRFYDGSGLSPMNRITPHQMTQFLAYQFRTDDFLFWQNLIPQGNEISRAGRYINDFKCLIHLHLKTGSISKVHNYAGYLKTKSGKMLGITAFYADYDCKRSDIRKSFFDLILRLYQSV